MYNITLHAEHNRMDLVIDIGDILNRLRKEEGT